jgi:hypothetical protein
MVARELRALPTAPGDGGLSATGIIAAESEGESRARSRQTRSGVHAGNMKGVREQSLKCMACASVANTLYMFDNQREVDDFLAGKPEW